MSTTKGTKGTKLEKVGTLHWFKTRQTRHHQCPWAVSYRHEFIPHEMQSDHRRSFGRPVEITLHSIVELDLQILDRFTLCMDTTTQRRGGITTRRVFEDFKYDFLHGGILRDKGRSRKAILAHRNGRENANIEQEGPPTAGFLILNFERGVSASELGKTGVVLTGMAPRSGAILD
jgi:hypothetical protein